MRSALAFAVSVAASRVVVAQTDSTAKLPGAYVERDTVSLVRTERIATLPAAQRVAWQTYIGRSRAAQGRDRALLDQELRKAHRDRMTRAPYVRESFTITVEMTDVFFASDAARTMGRTILSFQTPSGGWSKHVDMTAAPRQAGQSFFSENDEWHYIATLDNNATTSELEFLARLDRAHPDPSYRKAFGRGLDYLLDAQMPNGCWPQVYPLQGGYHDAATFNDDAMLNAVHLLIDTALGKYGFVASSDRERASAAVDRAERCIRDAQVVVAGKKTIWGQQHDPITLAPVGARSYEHRSLAARESVAVLEFLLARPHPDAALVSSIHAAAAWLNATRLRGLRYESYRLTADAGASPLWARMTEIGTNRPIFSNRDGKVLYDWHELTDRREGYGWFTEAPTAFLTHYEAWARKHPRAA